MPILMTLIGLLIAVSVWWWRIKMISSATNDVLDKAGKLKGAYKRRKFIKAANLSPIENIDDPIIAAAALIVSISGVGLPINQNEKDIVIKALSPIIDEEKATEATIYATWAVASVNNNFNTIIKLAQDLKSLLTLQEKQQLLQMIADTRAEMIDATPVDVDANDYERRLNKFKQKIGLEVIA